MKNGTKVAIISIIIVISIAAVFLLLAPAKTFIVDGVKYKVLTDSGAAGTIEVAANDYSGDVAIPDTVDNSGVTYTVTSIGASAFEDCVSLASVSMPGSLTSIGNSAFSGCVRLTSISIPDSVTSIGASAFSVSSLTCISIPAGVTSVQADTFSSCSNLKSIVFKGSTPPAFSSRVFEQVPAGLEVVVPRGLESDYATALSGRLPDDSQITLSVNIAAVPGMTVPVRCAVPTEVIGTDQYTGTIVWIPADSSFDGDTTYTAVITLTPKVGYTLIGVPANFFTVEGADSVSNAADTGVITAVFPATAPQAVVDIPAVSGVTPPERNAVPAAAIAETEQYTGTIAWDPENNPFAGNTIYTATITLVRKPGYTFAGVPADFFTVAGADSATNAADSGVITATFPVTAIGIGDTINADGINYKILTMSGVVGTVEVSTGSYSGEVALPETVNYAGVSYTVVSIGNRAFERCSGLTSVSLPGSVISIGYYAFANCGSLAGITIPGRVASIGYYAFTNCDSLIDLTTLGSMISIGDFAFNSCSGLKSINILGSVNIGTSAFGNCTRLESISIHGEANIGTSAFTNCPRLESISILGDANIGTSAFAK